MALTEKQRNSMIRKHCGITCKRAGFCHSGDEGKVSSRSNSTQSFDEALRDASRGASGATSPTIPENKPLS